jgi:hypothetical protein
MQSLNHQFLTSVLKCIGSFACHGSLCTRHLPHIKNTYMKCRFIVFAPADLVKLLASVDCWASFPACP